MALVSALALPAAVIEVGEDVREQAEQHSDC